MLDFVINSSTVLEWHVGEPLPPRLPIVLNMVADGHERELILAALRNRAGFIVPNKPVNPPDVPEGSHGPASRPPGPEGSQREWQDYWDMQDAVNAGSAIPMPTAVTRALKQLRAIDKYLQTLTEATRSAQALCEMLLSSSDVPIADIQSVRDELKRALEGK